LYHLNLRAEKKPELPGCLEMPSHSPFFIKNIQQVTHVFSLLYEFLFTLEILTELRDRNVTARKEKYVNSTFASVGNN
jgi:hypothetical protein